MAAPQENFTARSARDSASRSVSGVVGLGFGESSTFGSFTTFGPQCTRSPSAAAVAGRRPSRQSLIPNPQSLFPITRAINTSPSACPP